MEVPVSAECHRAVHTRVHTRVHLLQMNTYRVNDEKAEEDGGGTARGRKAYRPFMLGRPGGEQRHFLLFRLNRVLAGSRPISPENCLLS